ncbi:LuxR C-terminal-related transcriptional regulator [Streptomyces sp. NPDC059651]|uniref:LuxR C-terminal-related transcriptional regulator n=1 Tax=Streptomyces sp. NPDC059651 TaxID=3346897 RepID=UPI00368EBA90
MKDSAMRWAVEKIGDAAGRGQELVPLWRSVTDVLCEVVPGIWDACWYTVDPASLLVTSHFRQGKADVPEVLLEELVFHEHFSDDVNRIVDISRSASGIAAIHEANGGGPGASTRWRRSLTVGSDQELRVSLRTRSKEAWGALSLYREAGRPPFDTDVRTLLRTVAPQLALAVRQAHLPIGAHDHGTADTPGLIVLDRGSKVRAASPGIERWLGRLPDGDWSAGRLPSAVLSVAATALRAADREEGAVPAPLARVAGRSGGWLALHGVHLSTAGGAGTHEAAVVIEYAHPERVLPLLMSAYGLTDRERDVVRLSLQGRSTAQIAEYLVVSTHTVQQHLKSIFAKTGVRSRRDLVGTLFSGGAEPVPRQSSGGGSAGPEDSGVRTPPGAGT